MRLTNSLIDQAGNVWALNNWKPDFNTDVTSNPGGDGVVIFVGLATPTSPWPVTAECCEDFLFCENEAACDE